MTLKKKITIRISLRFYELQAEDLLVGKIKKVKIEKLDEENIYKIL